MKKIIFSILAIVAMAFNALAVEYTHVLVVNKKDGTNVEYKFTDMPVVTFEGENMKITLSSDDSKVYHPIEDLKNLTFALTEDRAVGSVESNSVQFGLSNEALEAFGLEEGTRVSVYDMSGRLVGDAVADAIGFASVNLTGFDKGVYAVKAGNNSFKFAR